MPTPDVASLTSQVLWAGFAVAFFFGAVAQRSHFCTMGAVSDVVNMGDWQRMRQWAMAAGLAMIGFGAMVGLGWIDPGKTLYGGNRWQWLSALVGGALFGFGMVLASGCGSKTLVRIGAGNLKSLVVFCVMALSAYATLRGITGVLRVATVDRLFLELPVGANLPAILGAALGLAPRQAGAALGGIAGAGLVIWALAHGETRRSRDFWIGGVGIGAAVIAMWWISAVFGHLAEHPDTLEEVFLATPSGRAEALSFTAPMAYALDWLLYFSDKNKVINLPVVIVAGVIAGSTAAALAGRDFRWEGFGSTDDLAHHLVGALMMGVGGVTALGCTVGQGLSGLSTLSLTSITAVAAIIVGAVAALRYQLQRA